MKRQKGFSLIELLIVVAIILIIAAIAIPNLIRARISANESSAVGSIRSINTGEITYATSYPMIGYTGLAALGGKGNPCVQGPANACLIDNVLAGGAKTGYTFAAAESLPLNGANQAFDDIALPASASTGVRGFCSDESGVIRYNNAATPAVTCLRTDSPL